jgi:hypothetical protein
MKNCKTQSQTQKELSFEGFMCHLIQENKKELQMAINIEKSEFKENKI